MSVLVLEAIVMNACAYLSRSNGESSCGDNDGGAHFGDVGITTIGDVVYWGDGTKTRRKAMGYDQVCQVGMAIRTSSDRYNRG